MSFSGEPVDTAGSSVPVTKPEPTPETESELKVEPEDSSLPSTPICDQIK